MQNGYAAAAVHAQAIDGGVYQGEYQYADQLAYPDQYADQLAYPDQYLQQMQAYDMQANANILQDPRLMSQEEKDRGLGSVFKRDDQRLQQLREKDAREKDPNFISESYSECYPGYQSYNHEIVDSDDEGDLSKMDMGGRVSEFSSFLPIPLCLHGSLLICLIIPWHRLGWRKTFSMKIDFSWKTFFKVNPIPN